MLKIGFIGFGAWVRSAHLPALQYDGRAKVTAVTASSEKTRQYAREVLGDEAEIYTSYEELLQNARIDAVMVAVPDKVHQAALSAALQTGLPVFYEPPISHLRDQIPLMADRLLAARQVTFAHLELCYHPAVARAAALIKEGAVGLLQDVMITLHANWGCAGDSDVCLMNRMSCWYVDVLNKITGAVPDRVLVLDGHGGPGRMQAASTGIYDYNGVWGILKADLNRPEEVSIRIDITGADGSISIDYFTGELRLHPAKGAEPVCEDCSPLKPYADYPAVRETVSAFLDAVISGDTGRGNAETVAQLNLIGLAAEESKDTGTWANVKKLR